MSSRIKGGALVLLILLPLSLFLPGLPWSAYCRHRLKKIIVGTEIRLNRLRGYEPTLVAIAGETDAPGARVHALDSPSGWATLCDNQGRFTLPDVFWYPGAAYDLVVSSDENRGKVIRVYAPSTLPPSGVIDAGKVMLNTLQEVDLTELPGDNSYNYEYFDLQNRDYYRKVFDDLTAGKYSDDEKVEAVNDYIATRLNYKETQWELGSPRRILERGSQYCGHLSTAMATILAAGFPIRMIHLTDGAAPPNTHAVIEVFYEGRWHLYDPTFGVKFKNQDGEVVSYKELRLNPGLISPDSFSLFREKYPKVRLTSLRGIYSSGHHHFYYLAYKCSQYAHAWWEYKGDLKYVQSGGRILLAAAGIRPGTDVTYHIRKAGSNHDELSFVSRHGANTGCVLDEEESPPINLAPGLYDVFVDLNDGNVSNSNNDSPAFIADWQLGIRLEVR
jgi:hypothetical protein